MRFSVAVACVSACAAQVAALSIFNGNGPAALAGDDDHVIPGESPLQLCDGDHDQDLVVIKKVDLSPNPPQAYVGIPSAC